MAFVIKLPFFPKFCSEEDVNFEIKTIGIGATTKIMNHTEENFRITTKYSQRSVTYSDIKMRETYSKQYSGLNDWLKYSIGQSS